MKILSVAWSIFCLLLLLAALGAALFYCFRRSEHRLSLAIRLCISVLLAGAVLRAALHHDPWALIYGLFAAVPLVIFWVPTLTGAAGEWFGQLYMPDTPCDPAPLYSIAESKIKRGEYQQAIAEIQKELAKFPGDFHGHRLLAEIHAEHLHDLDAAQDCIERFLASENISPAHASYLLNRQADWQLKFRRDPEAARACLERSIALAPESEQAQLAAQRISHLASAEFLAELKQPRVIPLAKGDPRLGLKAERGRQQEVEEDFEELARHCVRQLEAHPADDEAREKLAGIYARHYQRLDLAADQIEQLIGSPSQTPKQIVHWLNLLADWQIQIAANLEAARAALQRIIDRFPQSAAAEAARNRMGYLRLELKRTETTGVVSLDWRKKIL